MLKEGEGGKEGWREGRGVLAWELSRGGGAAFSCHDATATFNRL